MKVTRTQSRARNERVSNRKQRRQQHILEVTVRSHKAAQHRNRKILVAISKVLLVLATEQASISVADSEFSGCSWKILITSCDRSRCKQTGHCNVSKFLRQHICVKAKTFSQVRLSEVHDRLQLLPQVDEVQVVRKIPSEIDISIVERKPVAWLTSEKQISDPFVSDVAFLVDGRGVLMKEKKLLPEYLGLPLIVGCSSESLEAGKTVESFEAKAALELLRLSDGSFMQTRFQIREIDISKGYCLLVSDKNHTQVTFGFDNLDVQLQRLEQFLVYSDDSKRELATVNLLVQRNIPVTFTKNAVEVINETIDPEGSEPKILKAIPVTLPGKTQNGPDPAKSRLSTPAPIRKANPARAGEKGLKRNG